MEKNLGLMKPRYSEHILAVPWPFVKFFFRCIIFIFKNESKGNYPINCSPPTQKQIA